MLELTWMDAYNQTMAWQAYMKLGSDSDAVRYHAMNTLLKCGDSSNLCLKLALSQTSQPRIQFAAAIVLHWKGDKRGLETLGEALRWRVSIPSVALAIESAYIAIGSPDAVEPLLEVWNRIPTWGDHEPILASICRIWAALRNPLVLTPLMERALQIPELFEKTVPAFGEMSVSRLRDMTQDQYALKRHLAVKTLSHIPTARSFAALLPLLKDPDSLVISSIPEALDAVQGTTMAVREVSRAVNEGYASISAMHYLIRINPPDLYITLLAHLEGWKPDVNLPPDLTFEPLLISIPHLARPNPTNSTRINAALAELLIKQPPSRVIVTAVHAIGTRGPTGMLQDRQIRSLLWKLLTSAYDDVRREAAIVLAAFGEPFGKRYIRLLEDCGPQGTLLNKLNVVLNGGPDAAQAAAQAVQQVTSWFSRITIQTAEKVNPAKSIAAEKSVDTILLNSTLPEMTCQLLLNSLDRLTADITSDEIEETISCCVTVLRLIGRLERTTVMTTRSGVLRALHSQKRVRDIPNTIGTNLSEIRVREVAAIVRISAAETLIMMYGRCCFALFLEAFFSTSADVRNTAVVALGQLGDARAVPYLQPIAADINHPDCRTAIEAIAVIKRINPEMMTLLRGSAAPDDFQKTLLRAASGSGKDAPELLLRASSQLAE